MTHYLLFKRIPVWVALCTTLAACGGSGYGDTTAAPTPPPPPAVLSGIFVDSAVSGFHYATTTQNGSTDQEGTFMFAEGESVTFSIGDIDFPTVATAPQLSPFELAGTDDTSDTALINMSRLLQTLDADGDVDNGITISDSAHTFATGMTLDFTSATFDADVANLIANSGTVNTMLVDVNTAISHLVATVNPGGGCTANHAMVDWVATLSMGAHNVSGQVTIVDDCTIRLDNFSYDGGGLPDVFIYGGLNADYASGFAIGANLFGTSRTNASLTMTLPQSRTLDDFNGISVWCVAAKVDFGSGMFAAP